MKRYCTIALLSLATLNVGAGRALAFGWLRSFGCDKCAMCCKQYNAFSPPCMTPTCVKCWWPFCCKQLCCGTYCPPPCCPPPCDPCWDPCCLACPTGDCCGGSCGAPAAPPSQSPPPATMPPATTAPNYMPPAPTELPAGPQGALPLLPAWPYALPQSMMQPVVFHPAFAPAYYGQPAYYPMPGYGMPQGALPALWMGPR